MSADLYAAFGHQQPESASQPTNHPKSRPQNKAQLVTLLDVDDPDDNDVVPEDPTPHPSFLESWQPPVREAENKGAEVLFDATTEPPSDSNGEDEWGEFESAEQPQLARENIQSFTQSPVPPEPTSNHTNRQSQAHSQLENTIDLLSIDDDLPRISSPKANQPVQHPSNRARTADQLKEEEGEIIDDDWGEFIDGVAATAHPTSHQAKSTSSSAAPSASVSTTEVLPTLKPEYPPVAKDPAIRPTNIPPPSILLPLFPPLLEQSRLKAVAASKGNNSSPTDRLFADQLTSDIKTMARVVSGRQLRWKRDTILSQSTKIGPARSGRSGGMKLSSVNKSENIKEEKEAVEVIDAWRKCSGILNSVLAPAGRGSMPPMALHMQVRTATAGEGASRSTHACALCGLKREERIPRIDDDVNDSFGEWWLDHWGHADCEKFWSLNESKLSHR